MNWKSYWAARTQLLRRNTVREFLKYAGQPGMISFAGGLPDPALLPVDYLAAAAERVAARFGSRALQYGPSDGIPELRRYVAERFPGTELGPENVLITSGSQQALDLVGRVLLDQGDTVLAQNPTYLAALSAWSPYGVRFSTVSERPDLVYVMANFRNPSGETLTLAERTAFVRQCTESPVPLVEDDAYGDLRYEGQSLPSLLEIFGSARGPIIHIGTLSKVLAPGLRLGWVIADRELIEKLVQTKQAMDIHTSTLSQYLALQMIEDGLLQSLLPRLREGYRRKRDLMLECLEESMPQGVSWTRPEGGLFIMLSLPASLNGRELARRALESGVLVAPGEEFHIHRGENTIRLNFSHATFDQIRHGISKLADSIRASTAEASSEESRLNPADPVRL